MEKDGLDHAREDLGHVDADDLRDHLGEVDTHLQGLGLDEEIVGELVQLPDNLKIRRKRQSQKQLMKIKKSRRECKSKKSRGNASNADGCNLRLEGGGVSSPRGHLTLLKLHRRENIRNISISSAVVP